MPALLAALGTGLAARAEDTDMLRPYIQVRSAAFNEYWGQRDGWGLSLGANLNYYVGLELSADVFQTSVEDPKLGAISEMGILHFTPELRLRYPLGQGRWVPYLLAGPGVTFLNLNDQKPPGFHHDIQGSGTRLGAVFGAGLEYFVADNVTFSIEGKYEWVQNDVVSVDGVGRDTDFSTPLLMFGIRAYFREAHHHELIEKPKEEPIRIYGGVRYGSSILLDNRLNKDLRLTPLVSALGDTGNQTGSVLVGANITPHFGLELSANYNEYTLTSDTYGRLGKYANYTLLPEARWHWLVLNGRLSPFVSAGIGMTYAEFSHRKADAENLSIDFKGFYPAAEIGGGAEYFIARNLSFSAEAHYLTSWEHRLPVNGVDSGTGSFSALNLFLGMRFYLAER